MKNIKVDVIEVYNKKKKNYEKSRCEESAESKQSIKLNNERMW